VLIPQRGVPFSGILADGSLFDFMLDDSDPTHHQTGPDADHFAADTVLTVTLVETADFDWDFDVDGDDLAAWKTSFGAGDAADTDRDGDTDGADFLTWQRQQSAPPGELSAAVPEPTSLGLFALAPFLAFAATRRRNGRLSPPCYRPQGCASRSLTCDGQ
jgi:hypothetical protein